jgi:hypothetical protein
MRSPRAVGMGLLVALAVAGLGACSDDDDDSASTCADLQALAAEVRDLAALDFVSVGTDGVSEQLDTVDASRQRVRDTSADQFGAELDDLQTALSALGATIESAVGSGIPISQVVSQVRADVTAVSTSWDALQAAADDELSGCDLSAN